MRCTVVNEVDKATKMSYISYISCKKEARRYLKEKCSDLDTFKMASHVLTNQLKTNLDPVPVPWTFLRDHFGDSAKSFDKFMSSGLFSFKEYDHDGHRCREFSLSADMLSEFQALNGFAFGQRVSPVHLGTGKPYVASSPKTDANRNAYPRLIVRSLEALKACPINVQALASYVATLPVGHSDHFHGNQILNCLDESDSYQGSYQVSSTGRIFETFGLQGGSRKMRAIALDGQPVVNLDLVSSQANGLLYHLGQAGIPCPWLVSYVSSEAFRNEARGDLPKDLFKTLLYSTFFGGKIRPTIASLDAGRSEAGKAVRRWFRVNRPLHLDFEIDEVLSAFCRTVEPLAKCLDEWRDLIVSAEFLSTRVVRPAGKILVANDAGMRLDLLGLSVPERKRKLAAHLLQGTEALAIHSLTAASLANGFDVLVNCHDGFLSSANVPPELVDSVRSLTGVRGLDLVVKGHGE